MGVGLAILSDEHLIIGEEAMQIHIGNGAIQGGLGTCILCAE